MSCACCTKESATQSTPSDRPKSRSLRSFGVIGDSGRIRLGTLTPLRSLMMPATSTTTSMVLTSCATMRSRTLPSSIRRSPPGSAALKISGCGRGMRLAVPGAGSRSKRSFWPIVNSIGPLAKAPSRSLGPCRSMRIATGCFNCFSRARICSTRWRWSSCTPWLKLRRNTSAPASNRARSRSVLADDGPRVATILVKRWRRIGQLYFLGDDTLKSPACS